MVEESEEKSGATEKIKESVFDDERIGEENEKEENRHICDSLRNRESEKNDSDTACEREEIDNYLLQRMGEFLRKECWWK